MFLTTRVYQLFAITIFVSLSVSAQTTTLKGLVTDTHGAVIPGANIIVRSGDNVEFETQTNAVGVFLANVLKKDVSIEINARGFVRWKLKTYEVPNSAVVDLGTIVLTLSDSSKRIVDFVDLPATDAPIEPGEAFTLSEIQDRPRLASGQTRSGRVGIVTGLIAVLENENGGDKNRNSEKPVANGYVHFSNSSGNYRTRSDSKGHYRLELPAGKYGIYAAVNEACVICVEYYGKDFEIKAGQTFELNMVLSFIGEGEIFLSVPLNSQRDARKGSLAR